MRAGATAVLVAVVACGAGCADNGPARGSGSASSPASSPASSLTPASGPSGQPGSGAVSDQCLDEGRVVARADLDDDGIDEQVRLVEAGSSGCGRSLVARVDGRVAGVDVAALDLVPRRSRTVRLRGADAPDLVLLTGAPDAAGDTPVHLFALDGTGALREVTSGGRPVVPAVPAGRRVPMTASCTADAGIAVVTATAHQPPGIVLAWDLRRTTYDVRDGRAVEAHTATVRVAVADPLLRKQRPDLYGGALFGGCSVMGR